MNFKVIGVLAIIGAVLYFLYSLRRSSPTIEKEIHELLEDDQYKVKGRFG